jgi:hypothetical protein
MTPSQPHRIETTGRPGPISLASYQALVSELPRPTEAQIADFVDHVCHAHSWYKHMRLRVTRARLYFFLDPGAGMQHIGYLDGRVKVERRTQQGFHYSWIPTDEYRERFGHLAFSRTGGVSVALSMQPGVAQVPSDDEPFIFDPKARSLVKVPAEVLEAGCAIVSGVIHILGTNHKYWEHVLLDETSTVEWPDSSGGAAQVARMRARCVELHRDPSLRRTLSYEAMMVERRGQASGSWLQLQYIDQPFYQLVKPERERQIGGMTDSIGRMLDLATDRPD